MRYLTDERYCALSHGVEGTVGIAWPASAVGPGAVGGFGDEAGAGPGVRRQVGGFDSGREEKPWDARWVREIGGGQSGRGSEE